MLRKNNWRDFAADTVWLMEWTLRGELRRCAQPLYRKRYHSNSEHSTWSTEPRDVQLEWWIEHCAQMTMCALDTDWTKEQSLAIYDAGLHRLKTKINAMRKVPCGSMSEADLGKMVASYGARLKKMMHSSTV